MFLHDLALGGTYLRLRPEGVEFLFGRSRARFKLDDRHTQVCAYIHVVLHLQRVRHFPGLKQPGVGHASHSGQPASDKYAVWIVILRLFNRVLDTRDVYTRRTGLHLQLAPMNAGFVIQKLARQPMTNWAPV